MDPNAHRPQLEREQRIYSELKRERMSNLDDLQARAMSVALDTTLQALQRKPAKPKRLQLDDCLSILDHAIANFGDFDDERIKDAMADLGRAYQVMEVAVAAVEDERPSDPEPREPEDAA